MEAEWGHHVAAESSRIGRYLRTAPRTDYDPETVRGRLEQRRQEIRESLKADCAHGPRVRITSQSGGQWAAGLKCPADSPLCGIKWLSAAYVYQEWAAGQPVSPAGDGA